MNNTILVADDSPTELRLVLSALGKKGYTIVTATDGDDALEQARKHQPRLAILDIIMPGKNGFQVRVAEDRRREQRMKVLLLSSKARTAKSSGAEQGAKRVLTKQSTRTRPRRRRPLSEVDQPRVRGTVDGRDHSHTHSPDNGATEPVAKDGDLHALRERCWPGGSATGRAGRGTTSGILPGRNGEADDASTIVRRPTRCRRDRESRRDPRRSAPRARGAGRNRSPPVDQRRRHPRRISPGISSTSSRSPCGAPAHFRRLPADRATEVRTDVGPAARRRSGARDFALTSRGMVRVARRPDPRPAPLARRA